MTIPSEKEKYSYADYLIWDEGERIELIDGEFFNMSPAPRSLFHIIRIWNINLNIEMSLKYKNGAEFIESHPNYLSKG